MSGYKPSKRTKLYQERKEKRDKVERRKLALEDAERSRLEECQRIERIRTVNQEHRDYVEAQFKSVMEAKPVAKPQHVLTYRRRSSLLTAIASALLLCGPIDVKGNNE